LLHQRLLFLLCLLVLGGLSCFFAPKPALAAPTPPGFTDTPVANVASPTGLAFTPDERLLITT
jgi:hypothetical protein